MGIARQTLLDRTIAFVAEHGISDLSLRDIATAVGTSHRMIIYHFGTRDGLMAAIVAATEAQQRAVLAELAISARTPRDIIEAQWRQLTDPAVRPFVLLFFELLSLALRQRPGTEGFLDQLTNPWLDLTEQISEQLSLDTDRDDLRLGVAVVRGLLLEAVASNDYDGPTASMQRFLEMWETRRQPRRARRATVPT